MRTARADRAGASSRPALLGLGTIAILAIAPLFTHHVLPPVVSAEHGHIVSLCLVALHALLAPVHGGFHLVFLSGVLYALWDRGRAWYLGRRTMAAANWRTPAAGDSFWRAAVAAGADPRQVRILADSPTPAFTIGWYRPTIYIVAEAATQFDADQLTAVLEHEQGHVRRLDPLRLSLLRFLSCMLYWLPVIQRLASDLQDELEFAADRASTRPVVLASAILASARHSWYNPLPDCAGLHGRDLVDQRVRHLLGEPAAAPTHVTRMSLAGGTGVLALLFASALVAAHPEPAHAASHARHCEEHDNAFVHLFCMFGRAGADGDCPHAGTLASRSPE